MCATIVVQFQHVDTFVPHWGHAEPTGRQFNVCASVQSKCGRQMLVKFQHNLLFLLMSFCGLPLGFGAHVPHFGHQSTFGFVLTSGRSLCSAFPHELWISFRVFPRNVSILMYACWSSLVTVPETRSHHFNALSFPSAHTSGDKLHCTSCQKFSSTTAEMAGKIASLLTQCCQCVHFFWDHPCKSKEKLRLWGMCGINEKLLQKLGLREEATWVTDTSVWVSEELVGSIWTGFVWCSGEVGWAQEP